MCIPGSPTQMNGEGFVEMVMNVKLQECVSTAVMLEVEESQKAVCVCLRRHPLKDDYKEVIFIRAALNSCLP